MATKKKTTKEPKMDWKEQFRQQAPQLAYLLDEQLFGADMVAVLERSIKEKWFDSDEFENLVANAIAGTQYARTTTTNQQNFDKLTPANRQQKIDEYKLAIGQSFGALQFDDATLTEIATKAARDGRTGKSLEIFVYGQSVQKPDAQQRAVSTVQADEIRNVGRDYGVKVSDQEIQDVLTGKTTVDALRNNYKMIARKLYKGAEEDIDAGLTINQIFSPYKQYAAAVLEKTPDQVDFIDANGVPTIYADALQGPEGPLSLTEWLRKLKSDPKYGYQYTNQANQEVSRVVSTLEKAFGLRA